MKSAQKWKNKCLVLFIKRKASITTRTFCQFRFLTKTANWKTTAPSAVYTMFSSVTPKSFCAINPSRVINFYAEWLFCGKILRNRKVIIRIHNDANQLKRLRPKAESVALSLVSTMSSSTATTQRRAISLKLEVGTHAKAFLLSPSLRGRSTSPALSPRSKDSLPDYK